MDRRPWLLGVLGGLVAPRAAQGQPPGKVPRVGVTSAGAKALGLTIPPAVLARADELIQ